MNPLQPPQGSIPARRQSSTADPHSSPHQNYTSSNVTKQAPYPIAPNAHPSPESFYTGSPYTTHGLPTASPQYSSAEASAMMAAAQMQPRHYSMYTPQSTSPVSAVSSHGQEQSTRLYSQPPQVQHTMYYPTYAMGHLPTQSSHQMMTPPQTAVPQPPIQQPMAHPQVSMHAPSMNNSPHPQPKFGPNVPRPLDSNSLKSPASQMSSNHNTPKSTPQNGNGAGNASAAPGPIPATTPLVVRQDESGVQWIAFEYSKDRVKMEYRIRCDVESVNVEELDKEFKEANCVYPRAFCEKGQYTGNRLNYETECNTVGWSLVKLNPFLREKRGLIQRAVDSWRNSNQDSRLRSRRVRRMNKQTTRNKNHQTSQTAPQRDLSTASNALQQQRPLPQNIASVTPNQMHHHHANADSGLTNNAESLTLDSHFGPPSRQHKSHPTQSPSQIRPANAFQGYPAAYPLQPNHNTVSIAPQFQNGLEPHLSSHPATTISASNPITSPFPPAATSQTISTSPAPLPKDFSDLYPIVEKNFLNIKDHGHTPDRVRVKLNLRAVKVDDLVDDFRDRNSVFPRSYFPHQLRLSADEKRQKRLASRFSDTDVEDSYGFQTGRTTVKIPTMEGDSDAPVPRLGKRVGELEEALNDAGYRIGWKQAQKYDRRTLFLQRSLDAWRKRVNAELHSPHGEEASAIVPHQSLRPGKKAWQARRPRPGRSTFS